ncbi:MAG: ferritin-like domain-containing protein [Candidatus Hadarchaeum sp.]
MKSKEALVNFIEEQIKIEKEITRSLNRALVEIGNPAVKGALKGISLDSKKHAEMYDAASKLLTGITRALTQEHLDKQKELVKKHIRLEAELIQKISEVMPSIENEKVKLLLDAILSDEKRHHELLKKVLEILIRGETVTEEDWWSALWRDVPYHGTPGG